MTCLNFPPMLSRYLDRELSPAETAEVEAHLSVCEQCRALAESWRLQGVHMRNHMGRHTLGDDFVARVLGAAPLQNRSQGHHSLPSLAPRRFIRWLPAAAAVLGAAILLSIYFSSRDNVGYARVINPGELELLHANSWVHATEGELLHAGEWMRNLQSGNPEVQIRNSFRITLDPGTLAHIPDTQANMPEEVILMRGAVSSEIQSAGGEFRIHTPAGSITSSSGRFSVRVADIALPRIEIAADGSETATGTVVSVGEVKVLSGTVRIRSAQSEREVSAGAGAVFCESDAAGAASAAPAYSGSSLRIMAAAAANGTLVSFLTSSPEGLFLEVQADNLSLKKLLEWTTAASVRGGEDRRVTGLLRWPVASNSESIASAIAAALRVPISFRQEKMPQSVAAGSLNPSSVADWTKRDFSFQRSQDGMISFDFQSIPADQAFRILRASANGLIGLATGIESLPVTLHANGVKPEEASAWVGKTLGLQITITDQQIDIIEVGPSPSSPNQEPDGPQSQDSPAQVTPGEKRQASAVRVTSTDSDPAKSGAASAPPATNPAVQATVSAVARPLWSVLEGRISASGFYVPAIPQGKTSTDTGNISSKKREVIGGSEIVSQPVPSMHLIWPVLGNSRVPGDEGAYVVTNYLDTAARVLWTGYDPQGKILAQFEMTIAGSSALTLDPLSDFPVEVGPGGHWELSGSVPLVGSCDGGGFALGMPVESEMLIRDRSYPSSPLNLLGAHLWMVNPTDSAVRVVVAVSRSGKVIATVPVVIPAHGGIDWPKSPSGTLMRIPGTTIAIHALNGPIALGITR
jgi:hypothetical protein